MDDYQPSQVGPSALLSATQRLRMLREKVKHDREGALEGLVEVLSEVIDSAVGNEALNDGRGHGIFPMSDRRVVSAEGDSIPVEPWTVDMVDRGLSAGSFFYDTPVPRFRYKDETGGGNGHSDRGQYTFFDDTETSGKREFTVLKYATKQNDNDVVRYGFIPVEEPGDPYDVASAPLPKEIYAGPPWVDPTPVSGALTDLERAFIDADLGDLGTAFSAYLSAFTAYRLAIDSGWEESHRGVQQLLFSMANTLLDRGLLARRAVNEGGEVEE